MPLTTVSQSSLTLTASEQTVGSAVTSSKSVVLQLDFNPMVNGDWITLNCYLKTAGSGGTARLFFTELFTDSQSGAPVYQSIPVPGIYSVEFKMLQSASGTGGLKTIDFILIALD